MVAGVKLDKWRRIERFSVFFFYFLFFPLVSLSVAIDIAFAAFGLAGTRTLFLAGRHFAALGALVHG
jgi:hypothetical protein